MCGYIFYEKKLSRFGFRTLIKLFKLDSWSCFEYYLFFPRYRVIYFQMHSPMSLTPVSTTPRGGSTTPTPVTPQSSSSATSWDVCTSSSVPRASPTNPPRHRARPQAEPLSPPPWNHPPRVRQLLSQSSLPGLQLPTPAPLQTSSRETFTLPTLLINIDLLNVISWAMPTSWAVPLASFGNRAVCPVFTTSERITSSLTLAEPELELAPEAELELVAPLISIPSVPRPDPVSPPTIYSILIPETRANLFNVTSGVRLVSWIAQQISTGTMLLKHVPLPTLSMGYRLHRLQANLWTDFLI